MSWQDVAQQTRLGVLKAIPAEWMISSERLDTYERLIDIPQACGILTPAQIKITNTNACELLRQLCNGKLTSFEVTEAFCTRAAIAHQLVGTGATV
jgi:amidase